MAEKSNILGIITKIVVIGGAILVFALIAYLIITWVPRAISGLANIGTSLRDDLGGTELIDVSVNNSEMSSGEAFLVSWEYESEKAGEYYLSYSCKDSLIIDIESSNGLKRVMCNSPFRLGRNINSISLIPTITKENIYVDSEIEITFKDLGGNDEVANGTEQVTFKNTQQTGSNTFSANYSGSNVTSSPVEENEDNTTDIVSPSRNYNYGQADLVIQNANDLEDQSAFAFIVYNRGTARSNNWYFTYTDAENPSRTVLSPVQMALGPGQGLLTTVRFDGQRYDRQTINIFIDSTNSTHESNENNNRASVVIDGNSGSNYNYDPDDEADLVIEDLEVGRVSGSRFIEDDDIDEDDDAAVRFTVVNKGGESTGDWRFEISNTPYDYDDDYRSKRQSSLRPGESTEIVVEFDNPDEGIYNIEVEVDSDDDVDEENERNNTESERLRVRN